MNSKTVYEESKNVLGWWGYYYHILLIIHYILGVLGVLFGALIAAGFTGNGTIVPDTKTLGVLSAVTVGIVSFVQPGRMASVFYDAFWRLKVARLKYGESNPEKLLETLSDGYARVATIQPEALRKTEEAENEKIDISGLPDEMKKQINEMIEKNKAKTDVEKQTDAGKTPKTPKPSTGGGNS